MESRPLSINISSIHISGVGGLGMVGMVVVMALAIPLAAAVLVGSALGGALAAAIVIRRRHEHVIGTPGNDLPMKLGLRDTYDRRLEGLTPPDGGRGPAPRLAISY
jgi:hypothetical protein